MYNRKSVLFKSFPPYPFTDPANNPLTKYFPKKIYTSNVGNAASSAPAIWTFHWTIWLPERFCNATITGCLSPVVTVTANKNSFHIFVNCQIATTTKPVIESGIIMCLNTSRKLAPSILADQINEYGICE